MKGFNEFIGESELDPLAELPKLAWIRDIELAKPRDPEESIRWFNGFKSFLLSQLQITSLSNIVEIAQGHPRFGDMLAQVEEDRYPWGRKRSLGHYFEYYNKPVRYLSMLSGDFGKDIEVFWISREEYEKKFGMSTELDSLTSFIGESKEDWENWPLALPDRQYQYIEDHLGETPVFISSIKQSDSFNMLDEIISTNPIHQDYLIDAVHGVWSRITRFEPVDGLTILLIRPLSKEFQLYFALRAEDFQKLREGGLDQWKMDNLFGDFIVESVKDWKDFDATNIMSTEQCQLIEDTIGKNPEFISNRVHPEDFNMLDNMIEGTQLIKRISDKWAVVNKYEIVPGFEVIRIRPTSNHDSDRWIVIKYSDLYDLNLAKGNLDQWKIKSLFKDF